MLITGVWVFPRLATENKNYSKIKSIGKIESSTDQTSNRSNSFGDKVAELYLCCLIVTNLNNWLSFQ
jgi:hypothetical protein